ncbi:ABC transporter ATP-binding protein [Aquamicrobium defluvii]|uniref:ABC transporter n=1 Tax=Aquamicrobium defluvii TaxID=69279 RepID=A0A011V962_9HYPH|nr:ABC transporter ATP-binding protein [Aquamicrobium defluvii]EXL04935.1 ABC transporter [Aquamicrobium defluvii]EZQ14564.1 ABC transporter [Halopseudomonas bauzanensis]
MNTDKLLEIRKLTVNLPAEGDRHHAVEDLSLSLHRNEILCVVGESGSGKSITARAILKLLPPRLKIDSGEIWFEENDLLRMPESHIRSVRGARISMIFQEPMTALNPVMTIGRQIDELIKCHSSASSRKERLERILSVFDGVRLPDPMRIFSAYPHELSGGQRQRAMIAMALVLEPAVIIADEPTTALDVTTQAQILKLIRERQEKRRAGMLFVTHDFGVVAEIADRVAVMQRGRLVECGPATTVLRSPEHPYTKSLIAAVPRLAPRKRAAAQKQQALLKVEKLDKTYNLGGSLFANVSKQLHAVKSATFAISRGRTLGLVGESGSGKSTLARCIARLVEADRGEILLDGVDLLPLSRRQLVQYRKKVQVVFQDPYGSLNPRLNVGKLVAQGPIVQGVKPDIALHRAYELLELVGLDPRAAARFPHEFSGGQRQRIGIARALALEPELLIADEPVSALDVSVQAQVLRLLDDVRDRFNLAMLFITHDLRVAAQVCDDIAVMRYGEIVEYGSTEQIFQSPKHAYTQELLAAIPGREWSLGDSRQSEPVSPRPQALL